MAVLCRARHSARNAQRTPLPVQALPRELHPARPKTRSAQAWEAAAPGARVPPSTAGVPMSTIRAKEHAVWGPRPKPFGPHSKPRRGPKTGCARDAGRGPVLCGGCYPSNEAVALSRKADSKTLGTQHCLRQPRPLPRATMPSAAGVDAPCLLGPCVAISRPIRRAALAQPFPGLSGHDTQAAKKKRIGLVLRKHCSKQSRSGLARAVGNHGRGSAAEAYENTIHATPRVARGEVVRGGPGGARSPVRTPPCNTGHATGTQTQSPWGAPSARQVERSPGTAPPEYRQGRRGPQAICLSPAASRAGIASRTASGWGKKGGSSRTRDW